MNVYPRSAFLASAGWLLRMTIAAAACSNVNAATISYTHQSTWAAAQGGEPITVLHFTDALETHNKLVSEPTLAAWYGSQGIDFLPYVGTTSLYPLILRNQQYQIAMPNHDGLLANSNNPRGVIAFDFNITIRSVGAFSNNIDGGILHAYDTDKNLLGTALIGTTGAGEFGGLVSDTPIAHVTLTNTHNGDFVWGVYDLQFGPGQAPPTNSVPESGPTALLIGFTLALLAVGQKNRNRR